MQYKDLESELKELIKDREVIVDEDGICIYNDRLDHFEIFDSMSDLIRSAIHHRTFQQCI
jgi:hypothetical protein